MTSTQIRATATGSPTTTSQPSESKEQKVKTKYVCSPCCARLYRHWTQIPAAMGAILAFGLVIANAAQKDLTGIVTQGAHFAGHVFSYYVIGTFYTAQGMQQTAKDLDKGTEEFKKQNATLEKQAGTISQVAHELKAQSDRDNKSRAEVAQEIRENNEGVSNLNERLTTVTAELTKTKEVQGKLQNIIEKVTQALTQGTTSLQDHDKTQTGIHQQLGSFVEELRKENSAQKTQNDQIYSQNEALIKLLLTIQQLFTRMTTVSQEESKQSASLEVVVQSMMNSTQTLQQQVSNSNQGVTRVERTTTEIERMTSEREESMLRLRNVLNQMATIKDLPESARRTQQELEKLKERMSQQSQPGRNPSPDEMIGYTQSFLALLSSFSESLTKVEAVFKSAVSKKTE